jgi:phage-related baseplate assembly protein
MTTVSISTLFAVASAQAIFDFGLGVARTLGLPVTSWRTGDPTRSLYKYLAEALAALEGVNAESIKAGFLSVAEEDWLTVLAYEVYNVERQEATYATPTIVLENTLGALYEVENVGQITVKCSATGKTYHNTTLGTLAPGPGTSLSLEFEADEAGSDSSVQPDEVDEIVTTMLGVEIASSSLAIARDRQEDPELREQCRATTGALSPNGPADAYEFVARNPDLTGVGDVTRAKAVAESDDGSVIVYIAGVDGPVDPASVDAVYEAIIVWATPLCITPTVENASALEVPITATIAGLNLPGVADFDDIGTTALERLFADTDQVAIGENLSRSAIIAALQEAYEDAGARRVSVTLSVPAADVEPAENELCVMGTVSLS